MKLHPIDMAILAVYFIAMIAVGFVLEKRASRNLDSYFLGGNKMPWWLLAMSNATSMFDISGTMWLVYLLYVYGMKSVFIPWLWPVFNQVFLMVYLSRWLRRSGVMTGAEWITLRFGNDKGSEASRVAVVVFALVSVIGFTSYAFIGIGKFAAVFLPPEVSPNVYGLVICAITTLYTVMGGLYSVVITDVIQFVIMLVACFAIGFIAMGRVSPEMLSAAVPAGWGDISIRWVLDVDWSDLLPNVQNRLVEDGYTLFGAFLMMIIFKGVLVSAAGPAPNYDMQRILAAKNGREASLMSAFVSLILFVPRYFMIAGIAVLALAFLRPNIVEMGNDVDFEQLLPFVIRDFIPIGLVGVVLSGLLAAFMSTFAGTINAAAAYMTNDVYKRYIHKNGTARDYVRFSWIASILAVAVGAAFGLMSHSVHSVTGWIVSALWGGYAAPNLLKWHWWRLNGWGYFWGMMAGIAGALAMGFVNMDPLWAFPLLLAVSTLGAVVGSLATDAQPLESLHVFYTRTRPWGFWKPVHQSVVAADPSFKNDATPGRDAGNILLGVAGQTALVAAPIYIVIHQGALAGICAVIAAAAVLTLKKTWYDRLDAEAGPPAEAGGNG